MGYRGWPWHDGVLIRELRWLPQYQTFRVNSILSWYTAYQIRTKKATNIAPGNRISTVLFVIFVNRGRPELNYSADFQEPHTTRGHILRTTSCSDFRYLQPHLSIPLNPKRYALSRFLEGIFGFAIWEFINKVLVSMAPLTKYKYFSFILWGVITSIRVNDVFALCIGSGRIVYLYGCAKPFLTIMEVTATAVRAAWKKPLYQETAFSIINTGGYSV